MNEKDVSGLFTTTGKDVWRMIAYAAEPTACFENLETHEKVSGTLSSPNLRPFKRLVEEAKP